MPWAAEARWQKCPLQLPSIAMEVIQWKRQVVWRRMRQHRILLASSPVCTWFVLFWKCCNGPLHIWWYTLAGMCMGDLTHDMCNRWLRVYRDSMPGLFDLYALYWRPFNDTEHTASLFIQVWVAVLFVCVLRLDATCYIIHVHEPLIFKCRRSEEDVRHVVTVNLMAEEHQVLCDC